ncbi:hypothetical protein [Dyella sedimenti]|uniref:hypothetical protein n=1 Tax=Dyella sedimenti TaxID=2919947 RepID=UPI001FAA7CC9|nr:hypothetical protein [Dyella sedimenti]
MASTIPAAAFAGEVGDPALQSSKQTYALTPGSSAYAGWSEWIRQQQARKDVSPAVKGVGRITITAVSDGASAPAASPVPVMPDVAPAPQGLLPAGLPAVGTTGQRVTISNEIPDGGEQLWTYAWADAPGAWVLTGQGGCVQPHCSVAIATR